MSLTMREVMSLPALRRAEVVASQGALDKVVGSVSVLEYSQPTVVQNEIFKHINFNNDEIVLTAFASIRNDVSAQCQNIEVLANAGEIGMIIFYVGLIVPKIDPKVLEVAEKLNFLLICMPKNEPNLTYSSVITEIMFAIFNDQIVNPNFSVALIKRISEMPDHQRNMDMVLRLISNRIHASLALTSDEQSLIATQNWPRTNDMNWKRVLEETKNTPTDVQLYRLPVKDTKYVVFIYLDYGNLDHVTQQQTLETVQIALNLWPDQLIIKSNIGDLLDAIIQNEPQKIVGLAKKYRVDLDSLSSLLIINGVNKKANHYRLKNDIKGITSGFTNQVIIEFYEQNILIFIQNKNLGFKDWNQLQDEITAYGHENNFKLTSTRFTHLNDVVMIRNSYIENKKELSDAQIIFPKQTNFSDQDLIFSENCQQLIRNNEAEINKYLALFKTLSTDLIKTLLVFCLDAQSNIDETARQLYIHRNTAKYRIDKLSDVLGIKLGSLPESFVVYQLAAIYRITQGEPN